MNIEKIENINQITKNTLFTIKTLSLWLKTLHLPPIPLKTIYITANTAKVGKMITARLENMILGQLKIGAIEIAIKL